MPIGALVQIPTSLSRGGKCVTNLRGLSPGATQDYASPSRTFTTTNLVRNVCTNIGGVGNWANTIPNSFETKSELETSLIEYPGLLSSSKTGTLLFRMYLLERTPGTPPIPSRVECIMKNGQIQPGAGDGYAVLLSYDASGDFYALNFVLPGAGFVQMNSGASLNFNTWYTYGVKFDSNASPGSTIITIFENGTFISSASQSEMITPTGGTSLFSDPSFGLPFYGGITDFTILETLLSDDEIIAFATAPYI
jgi:hypothetical protein